MSLQTLYQAMRFGLVSGSGSVVNLMTFSLLHRLSLTPALCSAIAFLVACEYNFTLHTRLTFQVSPSAAGWFSWRFLALSVAALGVNLAVLYGGQHAGLPVLAAQTAGIAAGFPINFLGSRIWVFGRLST